MFIFHHKLFEIFLKLCFLETWHVSMYLKVRKRAWSIFDITLSIFILSFVVTLHNLLNHMNFVYMKYVKSSTCSFVFVYTLYLSHWIYQIHVHIIVIENRT